MATVPRKVWKMWLRTPKQIVQSQMRVPCNMILTTKLFTILNRILEGTAHVTPYQPQPQIVFLRSEFCGTCNSPCPNLPNVHLVTNNIKITSWLVSAYGFYSRASDYRRLAKHITVPLKQ